MTNALFMNDFMEIEWFKSIAREVVEEYSREANNIQAICHDLSHRLLESDYLHVFCACFSAVRDDLSQWRAYGDDGRGIAIGFDLDLLCETNERQFESFSDWRLSLLPVEYDVQEQRKMADAVVRMHVDVVDDGTTVDATDDMIASIYMLLLLIASRVKNPAFKAEEETRLVMQTWTPNSKVDDEQLIAATGLDVRESDGVLIPYVTIDVPRTAIREIVLGPRIGQSAERLAAVKLLLCKQGFKDVLVSQSAATYR